MAAVDETPVAVELATEAPQAEQAPSAMEVSEKSACEVAPAPTEQQAEAPEEKSGEPEAAPEAAPEERATDTMAVDAPAVTEEAAKEDASKEEAPEAAPKTEVQADAEPKAMEVEEDAKEAEEKVEVMTAAAEASPEAAAEAKDEAKEAATAAIEASAEAAVAAEAEGAPKAEAQGEAKAEGAPKAEAQGEAKVATKATPGASAGAKRKRGSTTSNKELPLEALASKIKRLQEEAGEAEAEVVALVAEKATMLAEIDARISKKRIEAEAKRLKADNGGKEYIKKQCEAALAQLESDVPKRPKNPYFLFSEEMRQSDAIKDCPFAEKSKKLAEMWGAMDEAGKQKYVDPYEAAKKRYAEWGSSEEGRKNLSERSELLRKVKAEGMEELNSALAVVGSSSPASAQKAPAPVPKSPAKRTTEASAMETPPKQRRATPAKVEPASKADPVLDEKVLAEATSAELLSQLRNLVARPEVLALGKTSQELLDVLKAKNGMVNAAKNALLSA